MAKKSGKKGASKKGASKKGGKKQRNFPFRARTPEEQLLINKKVSPILERVNDMLYKLVRTRVKSQVDDDQVQEIVQKTRVWLWQKSLQKYDTRKGVKVSTFLYQCASNFINQEVRSITRKSTSRRRVIIVDPELMFQTIHGSSSAHLDGRIEMIAQDVLAHPEKYLTAAQVQVFKRVTENPKMMMRDLAKELGYQRPSSLSMMMRRIRERIMDISIEDFVSEPNPTPPDTQPLSENEKQPESNTKGLTTEVPSSVTPSLAA